MPALGRLEVHVVQSEYVMPDEAALDLEFAFTTWDASCQDASPTLQQCRRSRAHDGQHAAGFGPGRHRWSDVAG